VAEHPFCGRQAGEPEVRVIPVGRYPYLIYWIIEAREIRIVHLRHAARERPETNDLSR
jgi:hypothetical protein